MVQCGSAWRLLTAKLISLAPTLTGCTFFPLHCPSSFPFPALHRSITDMTYLKLLDSHSKQGSKRWDGKPLKPTPRIPELDPKLVEKIKDLTKVGGCTGCLRRCRRAPNACGMACVTLARFKSGLVALFFLFFSFFLSFFVPRCVRLSFPQNSPMC